MKQNLPGFLVVVVLSLPAAARAADYVWVGPKPCGQAPCGGDWSDATNWQPQGVPNGGNDTATINGVSVALGVTSVSGGSGTLKALTLTGNAELSSCQLSVSSSFTWSGGTIGCKVTLASGASGSVTDTVHLSGGGELDNAGSLTWLAGTITGNDGAIIRNSGTFTASPGTSFGYVSGTSDADFYNTGTFTFAGPGTLSDAKGYWGLHNAGHVVVQSGAVEFRNAGNTQSTLEDGGHVSGAGVLRFTEPSFMYGQATPSSKLTISGTTTVDSGGTLELGHGGLMLGSGTIQGPGTFVWSGGFIQGGTTQAPIVWGSSLAVSLTSADTKDLSSGTVSNAGTVTFDGGDLAGAASAHFINAGTFDVHGDLAIDYSPAGGDSTALFENRGTLVKSTGTGALTIASWGLQNYGTVNGESGVVELHDSQNTDHVFEDGSTLQGSIRAAQATADVHVSLTGTVTLSSSATLQVGQNATLEGKKSVVAGPGTVAVTGGSLLVGDNQTLVFGAAGKVTFGNGKAPSSVSVSYTHATMSLVGTTTWSAGDIELAQGTLTNTGTFTVKTPGVFTVDSSDAVFDNQGLFTSNPGTDIVQLDMSVKNSGTIQSTSGTLLFAGYADAYTQTDGTTRLGGGSIAAYVPSNDAGTTGDPRTVDIRGGRLEGSGNVDAIVSNAGTLAPGTAAAAGALSITGTYTQTATGVLDVELGGTKGGAFDVVTVADDVTIAGKIKTGLLPGFTPDVGDTFRVLVSKGADKDSGKFASIEQPVAATFAVTYDPKDVTIGVTAVEPVTDSGVVGAGGAAAGGAGGASSSMDGGVSRVDASIGTSVGAGGGAGGSAGTSTGEATAGGANGADAGEAAAKGSSGNCSCRLGSPPDDARSGASIALLLAGLALASRRRSRTS